MAQAPEAHASSSSIYIAGITTPEKVENIPQPATIILCVFIGIRLVGAYDGNYYMIGNS